MYSARPRHNSMHSITDQSQGRETKLEEVKTLEICSQKCQPTSVALHEEAKPGGPKLSELGSCLSSHSFHCLFSSNVLDAIWRDFFPRKKSSDINQGCLGCNLLQGDLALLSLMPQPHCPETTPQAHPARGLALD